MLTLIVEISLLLYRRLGHGGFGKVYLITSKTDNDFYAAKYQKLTGNKIQRLVSHSYVF